MRRLLAASQSRPRRSTACSSSHRAEAGMDESDRPRLVQRQDQPFAVEVGLGEHELLEHQRRHRLSQPAAAGTPLPNRRQQRRIAIEKRAIADHGVRSVGGLRGVSGVSSGNGTAPAAADPIPRYFPGPPTITQTAAGEQPRRIFAKNARGRRVQRRVSARATTIGHPKSIRARAISKRADATNTQAVIWPLKTTNCIGAPARNSPPMKTIRSQSLSRSSGDSRWRRNRGVVEIVVARPRRIVVHGTLFLI